MLRPLFSIICLTLSVTACGQSQAPAPPVSQPANQTPPAAAPAQTAESQQATAAQESVSDATPEDRADASLERLAALPASQQLPDGKWKLGTNYQPLVPPQPTNVSAGKVEVVEMFWYGCPHCSVLEPFLANWEKKKPDYVELVRVPVIWGPAHRAHAKLFYTLEALGRPDLHQKVFETIHQERNMLIGGTEAETLNTQLAFAQAQGIDPKKFREAFNSFGVASNLQR